jgi:chitodextrinase
MDACNSTCRAVIRWLMFFGAAFSCAIPVFANDPGYSPPTGEFYALNGSSDRSVNLVQNQTLTGTGWATDPQDGAPIPVNIYIDGNYVCAATTGLNDATHGTLAGWSFTYTIGGSLANGAHYIYAVLSDNEGQSTIVNAPYAFTVGYPNAPTISGQPSSQTVVAGAAATFSVIADGVPSPGYQWRKNGAAISGATNASYQIASAQAADAANYTVVVSNGSGSVTSSVAGLTVNTLVSSAVFSYNGQNVQSYTVPSGANNVIIKAWGAGGGGAYRTNVSGVPYSFSAGSGGTGGFTSAAFDVLPGAAFAITVGGGGVGNTGVSSTNGGWPGGGKGYGGSVYYSTTPNYVVTLQASGAVGAGGGGSYSRVETPYGEVWAAGGGGAGGSDGGPGSAAAANVPSGSGRLGSAGGVGPGGDGATSGSVAWTTGAILVGGYPYMITGWSGNGVGGGGGGGGYLGGAGGACGFLNQEPFFKGGNGGMGAVLGLAKSISNISGGFSDPNYPGGSVASGGPSGATGGNGAVVVLAYSGSYPSSETTAPVVTSALTQYVQPGQQVDYWLTFKSAPGSWSVTGLPAGLTLNTANGEITGTVTTVGTYGATVTATNAVGTTQLNLVWQVDGTAPSAPAGLQISNVTSAGFALSWSAATDNLGISSYEVSRDGMSLGTVTGLTFNVTGLAPSTTYAMAVRTRDLAGNWSAWSTALNAATAQDGSAPTIPISLHTSNLSATFLTLNWLPATDDTGVTAYEVRRNGTISLGTTEGPSMTIGGLSAGTAYTFDVRARDAAGNWSDWSDILPVTTAAGGADILLNTQTFTYSGPATQSYTVPAGVNYIVVKLWGGAGGATYTNYSGHDGGYSTATYGVMPGDKLTVSVGGGGMVGLNLVYGGSTATLRNAGQGGWPGGVSGTPYNGAGGGGGYSSVDLPTGTIWAEGGSSDFSMGGLRSGGFVTGPAYNISHRATAMAGAGGTTNDPSYPGNRIGLGGPSLSGGNGAVVVQAYQTPGSYPTQTFFDVGSAQTFTAPAATDYVTIKAWGGGGGSGGVTSGGGGGYVSAVYNITGGQTISVAPGTFGSFGSAGTASVVTLPGNTTLWAGGGAGGDASAGGAGGSSNIVTGTQAPVSSLLVSGNGATPGGNNDSNYPGNNIGFGGANYGSGGGGAVVIISHVQPPVITSSLAQSLVQNATVNYTITGTNGATRFAATGLPSGLAINSVTGAITGRITTAGTYTSVVSASNGGGAGTATLVWTVAADTTPPSVPTNLQATNVTYNSFVLSWANSTDDAGVATYEVRRDTVPMGAGGSSLSSTVFGLSPQTTYAMSVRACDLAGNWSDWSAPLNIRTSSPTEVGDADIIVSSVTFSPTGSAQAYTVPVGTGYIVVKAWGAGGGSGNAHGGAGAYSSATYDVTPGQTVSVWAGAGGTGTNGGEASIVSLPGGTTVYAAGGGGGSTGNPGSNGGAGGDASGVSGAGIGGNGGETHVGTGGVLYAVGGAGGQGDGYTDDGENTYQVGIGSTGGTAVANGANDGGAAGQRGYDDQSDEGWPEDGGGGGGGFAGGGGGGGGSSPGGGGGGSSAVVAGSLLPRSSLIVAGSGSTASNVTDANYPGNNVGYGGSSQGNGGSGAVVIIAYISAPAITSPLTQSPTQNVAISYTITAANRPTSFAAAGLPNGLTLNPATGVITGAIATTGTFTSTISASNRTGTTQATLVWNVVADTTAPSIPTGLQASNITLTSLALLWTPSTDNAGVVRYETRRDGVSIGTSAVPAMAVDGLVAGSTYSFTVRAGDAAGNWSAWSSALSVTIPTNAPATSGIVGFNYAERTTTTVTLMWNPTADSLHIVGYRVYRNGQSIGTTSDTTYIDTGLTAGTTYSYTVRAFDGAGNESLVSVTLSVATSADFSADTDHDGVTDADEALLGTNPNSAASNDATNQLQLNIHRPAR